MLTKQVGMALPLKWPLRLAYSAIIFFFIHKKTTMDVWASLAQVFKVQVITRLRLKTYSRNKHSAYSAALSWLALRVRWWLTIALLDWPSYLSKAGRTWYTGRAAFSKLQAPTSGVPGAEHKLSIAASDVGSSGRDC